MLKNTSGIGSIGEQAAAEHLKANGFKIIAMNYKNEIGRRKGEIDIIAKEKNEIIFVEVKTRKSERYLESLPEENITPSKLHKLERIAFDYLSRQNLLENNYRFDAVSVWLDDQDHVSKIKHLRNIFL